NASRPARGRAIRAASNPCRSPAGRSQTKWRLAMSTNSVSDLRDTIVPKSDQLNAEQLLGGPITITVTDVKRGGGEEQPVVIHYEGEGGRPYKPCKSMRKVLVFAWGSDGREW